MQEQEAVMTVKMTDAEWKEYQKMLTEQEERKKAQQRKADRDAYRQISE